jgi:hypothetical protein
MGAKPKKEKEVLPEPINQPLNWRAPVIPKPHLSNTLTPLTSDPLWVECCVIHDDKGIVGNAGMLKATVTADSFVSLVRRTRENICAADKQLSQNKSPALYQYRNVQHLWIRIAACREHYG